MKSDTQQWTPAKQATVTAKPQAPSAVLSSNGRFLLAGGFDGSLRRWDLSPLHKHLASKTAESQADQPKPAKDAKLDVQWEAEQFDGHQGWVEALAIHELLDAKSQAPKDLFASADSFGKLRVWHCGETLESLWDADAHDGWIRSVAFSKDGSFVATCGRDQTAQVRSVKDGKVVRQWRHEHDLYALTFHPDGRLFLGDSRGAVFQWEPQQTSPAVKFDASLLYKYDRIQDVGGVKVIAVQPTGDLLAVAGAEPARGGTVQGVPTLMLFDLDTGKLKRTVSLVATKDCYVHGLEWHPDGFWMAVTCGTPGTGQLLFIRPEEDQPFFVDTKVANPHCVAFHEATNLLCVATTNKGSNGNGRRLNADGEYESNSTPLELFTLG